jgi:hypothetical protein
MSDSAHCAERAMFIAALPASDPERRAALLHARGCPSCSRALQSGERLLGELDSAASTGAPSPQALELTLIAVRALEDASARSKLSRQAALATLIGGIALALFSRHRAAEPHWLAFALCIGAAAVLAATAWRRPALVLGVTFALAFGVSYEDSHASELSLGIGLKCLAFELLGAALPVLTVVAGARRTVVSPARTEVMALAGAGSLAGIGALIIACPASHALAHLLAFHAGGVLIAAAAGFFAWPLIRSERA